jgi:hypothetical protein
VAPADSDMAE